MAERPSPNVERARRLLAGGALGGHLALLIMVAIFAGAGGAAGALSAAVAGILTIAFFTIGQAVQVLAADAPPKKVMIVSLASYGGRVTALGLLLMLALDNAERIALMDPVAVVLTTTVVVFGWLGAEFWVYSRLRIPVYDEPQTPSSNPAER